MRDTAYIFVGRRTTLPISRLFSDHSRGNPWLNSSIALLSTGFCALVTVAYLSLPVKPQRESKV